MKARILVRFVALAILSTHATAETIFGLSTTNRLYSFDSLAPGTLTHLNGGNAISGLPPNEFLLAIDFRPVATDSPAAALNGVLYALGSTRHLYSIDLTSGIATLVAAPPFSLTGTAVGTDFNPVSDLLRIASDTDENFRLDPNNASVAGNDSPLAFASGDLNFGRNPNIAAAAYANNFGGATQTTLYGIDSDRDALVRQGGINGSPSPNAGQLTTLGPLGFDTTDEVGLDISGLSGVAYASLTPVVGPLDTASALYTISLTNGAATFVGTIGPSGGPGAMITRDIAAPVGSPVPEPGAAGMLAVGFAAVLGRRKHRHS